MLTVEIQLLYSKLPYAHIHNQVSNAAFKIYREIERREPPARRPMVVGTVMSEFWDLLESCWNIQPQERPSTGKVVEFLGCRGGDIARNYDITQTPRFGTEET
jgi:hypothetical protein